MTAVAMTPELTIRVDVPLCAFRPFESREYQDTHPFPPPSAVYGMLLSLCGVTREEKERHAGVALALGLEYEAERSRVFRKLRRGRDLEDIRPDYQDLLLGVRLWVWLSSQAETAETTLVDTLKLAFHAPQNVTRAGGLSLGESSYLVDRINIAAPDPDRPLHFLIPDSSGFYSLPVWIDHAINYRRRERFQIEVLAVSEGVPRSWISINRK